MKRISINAQTMSNLYRMGGGIFSFMLMISFASAQNNLFPANGNAGIATTSPTQALQIGNEWVFHSGGTKYIGRNVTYGLLNGAWVNYRMVSGNGASLLAFGDNGEMWIETGPSGTQYSVAPTITRMRILNNGKVVIGAPTVAVNGSSPYKLYVEGGIRTEEVQVDAKTAWPDYVFADDYQLPSLPALGAYLRVHKHLPGFAPAAEVQTNGIAVGETIRLQQEKIEELYLHVIALEKRLSELETANR